MTWRTMTHRLLIGIAVLLVITVAAAAVISIVQLTLGSGELATRIAGLATRELLDGDTTRLTIGDVGGNGINHLTIRDVRLEVRSDGGWSPWCRVAAVHLDYSLAELLARPRRLRAVRVESLAVDAARPLPRLRRRGAAAGGAAAGGDPGAPAFRIDRLRAAGAVTRGEAAPVEVDLSIELEVGAGFVAARLGDCRLATAGVPPAAMTGALELRGGAVYLESLELEAGSSRLRLGGLLDGTRGARLRVELEPLALGELKGLTGWELVGDPSRVRGVAELGGSWSELELEWDLEAEIGADSVEGWRGAGRLSGGALVVHDVALSLNGVPRTGRGRLGLRQGEASWGEVRFEEVPLGSFPVLRSQRWLPPGSLSGSVRVGSASASGRPFELRVRRGVIHGFLIEPGVFRGAIEEGGVVRLDTVQVTTRGAFLDGHGTIDPHGELDLTHAMRVADLDAFTGMFGAARAAGSGQLRLAVVGSLRSPAFSVAGRLDSLAFAGVELEEVNLSIGPGILRRRPAADLELTARRGQVRGRSIGRVAFNGSLRDRRLRVGALRVEAAGAEVDLRGHVEFQDEGLAFRLDRLAGLVGGRRWRAAAPLAGGRRGELWRLEPFAIASDIGALGGSALYDRASGRTEVDLAATGIDLEALSRSFASTELRGTVDLEVAVAGRGDSLALRFDLDAGDLGAGSLALSRLALSGVLADSVLQIRRLEVEQGGALHAAGRVRFDRRLGGPAAWRELGRRSTWESAALDLEVSSGGLDLSAWHGATAAIDRLAGVVAFAVELRGSPAAPAGRITVGSRELEVGEELVQDLEARMELERGWIHLDELRLRLRNSALSVKGRTPVRIGLTAPPVVDRRAPVAITLRLEPGDLALSPFIDDRAIDTGGPVEGWLMVTGTVDAPHYTGELDLRDGRLRPAGREEVLRDVEAHVVLADDTVRIEGVRARSGDRGELRAGGALNLLDGRVDGYDFDVEFEHFPVRSTGEYLAEISGDLRYSRARGFPKPLPAVDTRLRVHRVDYLREVVGGETGAEPEPSSWTGRIELDLPRNAWLRNQDLEMEVKGQIAFERTPSGRTMLGRLEILRGTYDLFGHTFRMRKGTIDFVDPERIDPEVAIEAEARIPEARVTATISGRATDRQFALTSDDEDLDQATLWQMLVPHDRQIDRTDVSTLVAMTPFIRDLERRISREIPGLSVSFETVGPETGEQASMGARVGTYLGSEVFVSAYQSFYSTADQDVSVEYQISDIVFVSGEAERRGVREGGSADVEVEYNVNLNLRWEF